MTTDTLSPTEVAEIQRRSEQTCDAIGIAVEESPIVRLCVSHEHLRLRMEVEGVDLTMNF